MGATSCSDNTVYPEFCRLAASDDDVFEHFRSHETYMRVVETVDYQAGADYMSLALRQFPRLKGYLSLLQTADRLGGPRAYEYKYGVLGRRSVLLSPTTLRYTKVVADLSVLFGSLEGMRIVEIGGGYGGLCRLILDLFTPKSYSIVDLRSCNELSDRFLNRSGITGVRLIDAERIDDTEFEVDLIISNYAFSELSRPVQNRYVEKLVTPARSGYFLCNFATHTWQQNQYSESEMLVLKPGALCYKSSPPLVEIDLHCGVSLIVFGVLARPEWQSMPG